MSEPPKLNKVAVDNSPEPKPEKENKNGCLWIVLYGLSMPIALMATRNFAEYFEWKIPQYPVWIAFVVLITIFLVDWPLQKLFGCDYSAPFFKIVPLDAATWILLYVIFLFTLGPI